MKKILFITSLLGSLHCAPISYTVEDLTFETLAQNDWTDHVRAFRCLFSVTKIDHFLEFGTGRGSKYFLDHCNRVTSIEISTKSRNMYEWYLAGLKAYAKYKNWTPVHLFASERFDFFNAEWQVYHDPNTLNTPEYAKYVDEVNSICDQALEKGPFDVAFVDPGIVTRSDFVNCLFGKVDIIAAHDVLDWVYGWTRIIEHPDYEKVRFSKGCGVDFWIKKTKTDLIEALKKEIRDQHLLDN